MENMEHMLGEVKEKVHFEQKGNVFIEKGDGTVVEKVLLVEEKMMVAKQLIEKIMAEQMTNENMTLHNSCIYLK